MKRIIGYIVTIVGVISFWAVVLFVVFETNTVEQFTGAATGAMMWFSAFKVANTFFGKGEGNNGRT